MFFLEGWDGGGVLLLDKERNICMSIPASLLALSCCCFSENRYHILDSLRLEVILVWFCTEDLHMCIPS